MSILGKVAGPMLRDNLVRNGVDLVIDSNLAYFDVLNRRVGINTNVPEYDLDVNATIRTHTLTVSNSIVLPPNTALNYPPYPSAGEIRYNANSTSIEFFDGTNWKTLALIDMFTQQIYSDTFYGDNTTTQFTLSANSSSNSSLVSVNGVLQEPGTSYTITDNILEFFGDVPVDTDVIEARTFSTFDVINRIQNAGSKVDVGYSNGAGAVHVTVDNQLTINSTVNNTYINNQLVLMSALVAGSAINIGSTATKLDEFDNTQYRSAKYTFSGSNTNVNKYQMSEVMLIQYNDTVTLTLVDDVGSDDLYTITANVNAGKTQIWVSTAGLGTQISYSKIYFPC
jgi:hypothetical protein